MDLIGNIKFVENRLGRRKPEHGKGKPVQKNIRSDVVDEKDNQAETNQPSTEYDTRLGQKLDTTA